MMGVRASYLQIACLIFKFQLWKCPLRDDADGSHVSLPAQLGGVLSSFSVSRGTRCAGIPSSRISPAAPSGVLSADTMICRQ